MAHLTTGQIKQLLEIDSAGEGIRGEVQELIKRLTSGGVGAESDDPFLLQAKRLWDKGFGERYQSFSEYLGTIPGIPEALKHDDVRFPFLVLVDARLSLKKSCELAGVIYVRNGRNFEDYDPKNTRTERVYWMRCQDGQQNRGKTVEASRENFAENEIGLTAMEGIALYAQHPAMIKNHSLELVRSVIHNGDGGIIRVAWFGLYHGVPKLDSSLLGHTEGDPDSGTASCRKQH